MNQLVIDTDVFVAALLSRNDSSMAMGTAWQAETQRLTGNENLRTDLVIGCVDNRMCGYYIVGGVRARPH